MYRFKDTPQELPELVIDALNLFGHGIRHIWPWALMAAVFSLVGPYLVFETFEVFGAQIQATVNWFAMFVSFLLSIPGAFCVSMIARRLYLLGTDRLDGEQVTDSMKLVLRKLPVIYAALICTSALSVFGWLLIFAPGIFFGVVFVFVMPLILLDDYAFLAAFKESWHLVWGNWWRIFAMLLIPLLILAMVSVMPVADAPFLSVLTHTLVIWFDIPLLITFMLTMFYDTKLRHDVPLHLTDDEPATAGEKSEKKA